MTDSTIIINQERIVDLFNATKNSKPNTAIVELMQTAYWNRQSAIKEINSALLTIKREHAAIKSANDSNLLHTSMWLTQAVEELASANMISHAESNNIANYAYVLKQCNVICNDARIIIA